MREFIYNDVGRHNGQWDNTVKRVIKGKTYKDLSTIWITPTRGTIAPRVVSSWMAVSKPMNQPFVGPLFIEGDEVGEAYEKAFNSSTSSRLKRTIFRHKMPCYGSTNQWRKGMIVLRDSIGRRVKMGNP